MSKHFCMLAHKYDPKRVKSWPVAVEPKLDGVRVLAFVESGRTRFVSRSNKPFPALDRLREHVAQLCFQMFGPLDIVLDCEAVSGTFRDTVSSVRRKSVQAKDAVLYVFDVLRRHEFDSGRCTVKYVERRTEVERLNQCTVSGRGPAPWIGVLPLILAHSHEEVMNLYQALRCLGMEGAMVKSLDGEYSCKRSYAWMKIKDQQSVECKVLRRVEGEGKHAGRLGKLVVLHNGVEVGVGAGFTDVQREELWECKLTELSGRIVEVQYHEETPDGSLRHPRFVRFRDALTGAKE